MEPGGGSALDTILQLALNGLAVGCIYGLVALGFVLIYKATELVNFAQGDLLMLGAFVCYMLVVGHGMSYWPAFAIAVVAVGLFGAALDATILRRVAEIGRGTIPTQRTIEVPVDRYAPA